MRQSSLTLVNSPLVCSPPLPPPHPLRFYSIVHVSHSPVVAIKQREQASSGHPLLSPSGYTLARATVSLLHRLQDRPPWREAIAKVGRSCASLAVSLSLLIFFLFVYMYAYFYYYLCLLILAFLATMPISLKLVRAKIMNID